MKICGQWVSPDRTELLALLDEPHLETYQRYREGDSIYLNQDGATCYTNEIFPCSPETQTEMERLVGLLDSITRRDRSRSALGVRDGEFPAVVEGTI